MVDYPSSAVARDRFVLERRGGRPAHDPWQPQGVLVEEERAADGTIQRVATAFLTGRECPWRCVMCDLWRFTTLEDTPAGAIPAQIRAARDTFGHESGVSQMKLYNAGSFFDPRAVPVEDYPLIAAALDGMSRVIVESHPALVGPAVDDFAEALRRYDISLEVAMGLETAHPDALELLHKRMTVDDFVQAADALRDRAIALRVFLLLAPPFIDQSVQEQWLVRSVEVAFGCGATAISLVPLRAGNGAIDVLAGSGHAQSPVLAEIERLFAAALAAANGRGRVFLDLWDLDRVRDCARCFTGRRERLHRMNLEQLVGPPLHCGECGGRIAS